MTALDEWMSGIAAFFAGDTDSRIDKDNAEWSTEARYHGWVAVVHSSGRGYGTGIGTDEGSGIAGRGFGRGWCTGSGSFVETGDSFT